MPTPRKRLVASIVGLTTVLVIAVATPAAAATYNVTGTLNCVGDLAQYDTYRPHSAGPASMRLTRTAGFSNNDSVRFGLRNTADVQITTSPQFENDEFPKTKSFLRASNNSSTIPSGSLAINARLVTNSTGCGFIIPKWEGTLTQ